MKVFSCLYRRSVIDLSLHLCLHRKNTLFRIQATQSSAHLTSLIKSTLILLRLIISPAQRLLAQLNDPWRSRFKTISGDYSHVRAKEVKRNPHTTTEILRQALPVCVCVCPPTIRDNPTLPVLQGALCVSVITTTHLTMLCKCLVSSQIVWLFYCSSSVPLLRFIINFWFVSVLIQEFLAEVSLEALNKCVPGCFPLLLAAGGQK